MNTIGKQLLSILLLGFTTMHMYAIVNQNQINKVYHHTSHAKTDMYIELGSLVFYFAQEPEVKLLMSRLLSDGLKEDIFLFPKTKADYQIIRKINAVHNGYIAKFERTPSHQGLQLTIKYDPKKIGITHDTFDSINMQKGLVIRFFNREILKKIREHPKPILQIAALQKISKKKRLS